MSKPLAALAAQSAALAIAADRVYLHGNRRTARTLAARAARLERAVARAELERVRSAAKRARWVVA